MPDTLLGIPLKKPMVFGLIVDGELEQLEKILLASSFAQRGLNVDFLVGE